MQLLADKKAVIIRPKSINRFLKLVPTAKPVTYKGKQCVAVPHRMDEVRVLNNLGVAAPSPMLRTYDFPRGPKIPNPFDSQLKTAGFLSIHNRAFVLNDLGTGKTLAALWAYDYLRKRGEAKKLLIISPLSTLERTWADEVFFNLGHLETAVLYKTKPQRLKQLSRDVDVYIINHHGVQTILPELMARDDIDTVIIDEVAQVCRNRTDMWDAFNKLINGEKKRRCWGLTATPTPNEPVDAYYQIKLMCPERMPIYARRFKDMTMQQVSPFKWIAKVDANETVDEYMQPAIRFRRSDCIDLPDTIYLTRETPLSTEQRKAYTLMENKLYAEIDSGEITAVNDAVKAGKLVQIACGVVYDDDGNARTMPAKPRIDEVISLLEQSPTKTIVFVPYRAPLEMVAEAIRAKGYTVGVIHGGVSKTARDNIFGGFQNHKNPQVIVAQPAAMSHGLTLTAAAQIVWYAPVTSAETYEQANGRITRPGQKHRPVIVHLQGTEIERRIYSRLKSKQKMQNILLEMKTSA